MVDMEKILREDVGELARLCREIEHWVAVNAGQGIPLPVLFCALSAVAGSVADASKLDQDIALKIVRQSIVFSYATEEEKQHMERPGGTTVN